MTRRNLHEIVRYLQQLTHAESSGGASDGELLERYVRHRDEAAFELLLWRHGALVFNVCRRILPREQDAEDAFQATFLAFVRKAPAIVRGGSVASWLYKVAYRVALAAQARARKIAALEKLSSELLATPAAPDPLWQELRPILDEEVNRLPERLRRPFVLCYLEGKTNEEAARQLGCPAGTIFSRLSRGREMLRRRLLKRGVSLSVAALTAALGQHALEAAPAAMLMTTTVRAALLFGVGHTVGGLSTHVTALAEGVLRTMFVTKLKMTALMVLLTGLFAAGGVFTRHVLNAAPEPEARDPAPQDQAKDKQNKKDTKPAVRVVQPTAGGLSRTMRCIGHVRAAAQQQVFPIVSGYLLHQAVDIGDRVKKGQVLAEIDAPLLAVEVKQAQAALRLERQQVEVARTAVEIAQAEVKAAVDSIKSYEAKLKSDQGYLEVRKKQGERYAALLAERAIDEKLVAEQQERREAAVEAVNASRATLTAAHSKVGVQKSRLESAKAMLEMAAAKMEMARCALEKAELQRGFAALHANFDGIVTRRNFDVGDFIAANDSGPRRPLMTVLRTDLVRVVVDVTEADAPLIRPGLSVKLQIGKSSSFKSPECKVSRVGFSIDEGTATMPVEIDVPNPQNLLRPGISITAAIHLDEKAPVNAVTVPASCVLYTPAKKQYHVYIVRDDKAHLTPVRVSYRSGDKTEIDAGVQASDRVVLDPRGLEGEIVTIEIKKTP